MLVSSLSRPREGIERAGGRAEMPLEQMQVDSSDLEVAVAEQYLDGAQVGAGFKQVCREAMAQSVRMDVPVLKASPSCGNLQGSPEDLGGDRVTCRVPAVARKEPLLGLVPEAAPISSPLSARVRSHIVEAVRGEGKPVVFCAEDSFEEQ